MATGGNEKNTFRSTSTSGISRQWLRKLTIACVLSAFLAFLVEVFTFSSSQNWEVADHNLGAFGPEVSTANERPSQRRIPNGTSSPVTTASTENVIQTLPDGNHSGAVRTEVPTAIVEVQSQNRIENDTDPVTTSTTSTMKSPTVIKEFERQERVVIATKIHYTNHLAAIEQSLCLLHYAYNNRVLYDIVVFSTAAFNETLLEPVRKLIAPAKLTLVEDSPGLKESVDALEPDRKAHLLDRCNVTSSDQLDWYTYCHEFDIGGTQERLAYSWQAEFRALHVWTHPALADYDYMMWFDSDAFCTRVWDRDPIAIMIQNDLVLMFDHFNADHVRGTDMQRKYVAAFNTTLCKIHMTANGTLQSILGGTCPNPRVKLVHGFFHITNLKFYRSEPVLNWSRILIGDTKYSRKYCDQTSITIPAAVLAPNRSWEMGLHGITLDVFHNGMLDGQRKAPFFAYTRLWRRTGEKSFPSAYPDKCPIKVGA